MKEVNGLPVYEEGDICALDEYSATMAQKVHQKIESAKYDDTEVKGDIEEIHGTNEEQYKEIATLRNSVINLKDYMDNMLPNGQASGEDITINDSAKYPCKIEVGGNSWQKTREGYNLLNADKEFTVNQISPVMNLALEPATYTIKFDDVETSDSNVTSYVCLFLLDNTNVAYVHITKAEKKKTFTLNSAVNKFRIWSADSDSESTGVTTTYKNLMIYAGNENKEYEEYGVSPSTKYPSNLEAVGDSGSLKVTVSNKNMFNKNNFEEITGQFQSGYIAYNYNEKILYFKCKKNCSYAFQKKNGTLYKRFSVAETKEKPELNVALQNNSGNADKDSLVYTTSAEAEYIVFWYYSTGSDLTKEEILDSIQIEEGNEPTYYIAHEEQNAIFPFTEGQRLLKNCKLGDAEIIQNRKRIICNGTESWTANATSSSTGGKFRWRLEVADIKQIDANTLADVQCTHYKAVKASETYQGVEGIATQNENITIFNPDYATSTAVEWKEYVTQQYENGTPIIIEYELAEPETVAYTEAQKTAKAEIDKLTTYKGVTRITTDSKAILDVSYKKDLETLINNISNAGEG